MANRSTSLSVKVSSKVQEVHEFQRDSIKCDCPSGGVPWCKEIRRYVLVLRQVFVGVGDQEGYVSVVDYNVY